MNIIKVDVNFTNGTCKHSGINLITGDFNSTKIIFNFDREDGTKIFEMNNSMGDVAFVSEIQNNEVVLVGKKDVTTDHDNKTYIKYMKDGSIYWYQNEDNKLFDNEWNEIITFNINEYEKQQTNASILTEPGRYPFEISLYNGDSKLTSASGSLVVKLEQVDLGGEYVEPYLPIFDQLIVTVEEKINEVDEKINEMDIALEQVDNLDIDGSKVEDTTTITITRKDGTTKEFEVKDGIPGPQGIPGEKGETGSTGPQGLPGQDAKINGYNTLTIEEGTNIELEQTGNVLKINNTYDDSEILEDIQTIEGRLDTHDTEITTIESDIDAIEQDVEDLEIDVDAITTKIPNQATAQNQLADKDFVNSSIATNTANFRGTYESTSELPTTGNTPNDYAFVVIYDETTGLVKQYDRYKWTTTWVFEYTLNNSSFTANQWSAINSGITSSLVTKLDGIDLTHYYTKTESDTLLGGKVDKVTGKGLSTNDYTTAEKTKLAGIDLTNYATKQYVEDYVNSLDGNEVSY